jgi:hypothetical protein
MRRFLPALLVLLFLVGPVHGQSPDSILVSQEVLQTLADVASASIDTTATSGASGKRLSRRYALRTYDDDIWSLQAPPPHT